ncbi:MAG: family 10 glycosylhydrolase [Gemmatimonadota bacterium]
MSASNPALAPPPVPREFRGVWVATVGNVDWPSREGLSTREQQAELLAILDRAASLNLNAVVFQVRPAADAFYDSPYEPWSEYLTGTMGRAPHPYWDPLRFAVKEAHARGLELHAWFNPFRARRSGLHHDVSKDHISRTHPELVREYGDQLWLDPGEPAARAHSLRVILDVVRRYDIDGVHLDDYFYPYPVLDATGHAVPFPDNASWRRYVDAGGTLHRPDWRRANIDGFVEALYDSVKAVKPWVKLGIAPMGTWRPGHPAATYGYDAYGELYADARKWLWHGWMDYVAPQLYWPIARSDVSFPLLLDWWMRQNLHERHVWPGLIPSRVGSAAQDEGWSATEILREIHVTRGAGAGGNILFSMRALLPRPDSLARLLRDRAYQMPALVPASPWLDRAPPAPPAVLYGSRGRDFSLRFRPAAGTKPWLWVVQLHDGRGWTTRFLPGGVRRFSVSPGADDAPDAVFVFVVDRCGEASRKVRVDMTDEEGSGLQEAGRPPPTAPPRPISRDRS